MMGRSDKLAPIVVIAADSEEKRWKLSALLEQNGVTVAASAPLGPPLFQLLSRNIADILLVDLDDSEDSQLDRLDSLLEQVSIPVLFNDSAAMETNAVASDEVWSKKLVQKLMVLSGHDSSRGEKHPARVPEKEMPVVNPSPLRASAEDRRKNTSQIPGSTPETTQCAQRVWVLGAALGGPPALKQFLGVLPKHMPIALIVAQHIGAQHIPLLIEQLDRDTQLQVLAAEEGQLLRHGQVVLAPAERRMVISKQGRLHLLPASAGEMYPIDDVMNVVAEEYREKSGAIMFSGIGNDGVKGCSAILEHGGTVWAQDAASCVISSMPDNVREACEVGLSAHPVELARNLVNYLIPKESLPKASASAASVGVA